MQIEEIDKRFRFLCCLKEKELTVNQAILLVYIYRLPGAEQKDMNDQLEMGASVMSTAMQILISRGLVRQEKLEGKGSNRKAQFLTDKGDNLAKYLCEYT